MSITDERLLALAVLAAMGGGDPQDLHILLRGLDREESQNLALTLAVWHIDSMTKAGLDPVAEVARFRALVLAEE